MKKYLETTWRLWKLLKPFHKYFYSQLFFTVAIQLSSILTTLVIAKIIDKSILKDWRVVIIYFIVYFILLSLNKIFSFISGRNQVKNSYGKIQQFLEGYSLEKILTLNVSQYIENHSAIRLQIIDRGEVATQRIIETLLLQGIPTILMFLLSIAAISYYSINIALISIISIVLVIFVTYKFTNYIRPKFREDTDNWDKQRKIQVEAFEHLRLIKLFGMEDNFILKYLKNRLGVMEYFLYVWLMNTNFANWREIFLTIIKYISLIMAILLFSKNLITIGIVYALFSWINNMYSEFGNINLILRNMPTDYISLEKYLDVIDMKSEFKEEGENKFKAGDIVFENVNFKYPKGDNNVLHDLSFKIKEGSKVAFVGYSGSGKTTIIQLLLRAYNYKNGDIKIGEVPLKEISANSLREHIGYVEQHVDLFDDTIKENILFGVKDINKLKNLSGHTRSKRDVKITEEEINNAIEELARKARIDQFYHRLGEKKFETMIGERGIKLSGGERQRVGIARALIKDPAILIFDEATSALDAENEKYIKEAIEEASVGRTTIIIAHRLSTVRDVDQIFMMKNGKILASGNHETLLKTCKEYKELVEEQLK